jgi:hypothetical protein
MTTLCSYRAAPEIEEDKAAEPDMEEDRAAAAGAEDGACGGGRWRTVRTAVAHREKPREQRERSSQETWRSVGGISGVRWPRPVRLMQAIQRPSTRGMERVYPPGGKPSFPFNN